MLMLIKAFLVQTVFRMRHSHLCILQLINSIKRLKLIVVYTYRRNWIFSIFALFPSYITQLSRICVPVPLYHCFGMVLASLQTPNHGATCVFPGPGFDADSTLKAVSEER